ncbi:MAG: hypothetical protein IPN58_16545 [Anaerolineales bacterium]|nr:hypothetical protein [Anaerolineales bacterium]
MKRDLYFSKPIMNTAGLLGFAPDPRAGINFDAFGAFVTNPISLRSRLPAAQPALIEFPGGFLLHSGLPNPGLSAVLKKHAARWNRADMPIIVNLMADRPEETMRMVQMLEGVDNVMAVELGFAPLIKRYYSIKFGNVCRRNPLNIFFARRTGAVPWPALNSGRRGSHQHHQSARGDHE